MRIGVFLLAAGFPGRDHGEVLSATAAATAALATDRGLPMLLGMHVGDDEKREMVAGYAAARGESAPASTWRPSWRTLPTPDKRRVPC